MEKSTVTQDGKTVLEEKRYHGLLGEDGTFRLLGCYGKRFPGQKAEAQSTGPKQKKNEAA